MKREMSLESQRIIRLRATNAKLLEALEEWSLPYIDYVGFIESDVAKRLERTRAAIEEAKERPR